MKHLQCILLSALVLAAIGSANIAVAESLKVAYNQWAGFSPVFVAAEKGYFKEAGLDVELVAFPGPGDSLAPLLAGHIDVSLTTPDNVIIMNAGGADLVCTYMIDTSDGADAIIAKAGINKPADLKGKTVATTVGEVNHLLLLKALEAGGVKAEDVNIVNMNPDDAGAAFVAGSVDAAVTWEPWISQAKAAGGKAIFSSADAPNIIVDVMAMSKATLKNKFDAVAALAAGIDKGLAFMRSDPEAAYALAGKWLEIEAADVAGMLEGVKLYSAEDNAEILTKRTPLTGPLAAISAFLKSQNTIEAEPDVDAMVDDSLVDSE